MLTDASRKFHGTLDAQKAVQKQGKMNPGGCLPEVPRNIGCAEEHRRDMDAQKAAVYGLLPELKISMTKSARQNECWQVRRVRPADMESMRQRAAEGVWESNGQEKESAINH